MQKIILICFFVFLFVTSAFAQPTAKITIKAVDDFGRAIVEAQVHVSFSVPSATGIGLASKRKKGTTNAEGLFVIANETMGITGFSVDKEGYYQSGTAYTFTSHSKLLNRWEPWNPTVKVVLKNKRNPVPMYMNNTNWAIIPRLDSPVGFDLEKGDWVSPYGNGVVGDLLVRFSSDYKAYRDYESRLIITFSNEKDGIQEYHSNNNNQSSYKWPFEAPQAGYLRKIEKFKSDRPGNGIQTNVKKDIKYIFRVRTITDKDGNIIQANYGKIGGDFQVGRKPKLGIGYYFNPDGTRNLEEDPEKNLFKNK